MEENRVNTETWLRDELEFINTTMANSLNGRMHPELVSCDDESKTIVLRYPLQQWEVNGLGTLHGGIINTMLDLTMSIVVYCFSRETIPPTVSMSTNYLRPVPMEEYVYISAKLTSLGKRNATSYSEAIVPATGKVACTAIGTYAIVPKK